MNAAWRAMRAEGVVATNWSALGRPGLQRSLGVADLDEVMAIEALAYSFPWSRGNFIDSLQAGYVAERRDDPEGSMLGYFVAMPGIQELHLLNLTVAPASQGRGQGHALLERVLECARQRLDTQVWLEVRQSNDRAIALYRHHAFIESSVRRAYYPGAQGPREDAVVMRCQLS